jgi:hypothetical protein
MLLACALLPAARVAAQAVQPLFLHPAFYVGTQPQSIASGDFDRDGRPDVVTADAASNSVSILLGQGNGSFSSAGGVRLGSGPTCVAVADLDADGDPDLATAHTAGSVSLLPGQGDGSFAEGAPMDVGAAPEAIVAADFDLDGLLDLADTAHINAICWAAGAAALAAQPVVHVAQSPVALAAGDLMATAGPTRDWANSGQQSVSVLLAPATVASRLAAFSGGVPAGRWPSRTSDDDGHPTS